MKTTMILMLTFSISTIFSLHLKSTTNQCQPSYTVKPGDTLTKIAAQNGVSVDSIVSANSISNPDLIIAGQTLKIPCSGSSGPTAAASPAITPSATPASAPANSPAGCNPSYVVKPGDTLTKISAQVGVPVAAIVSANSISNPDLIIAGQTLKIPC